MKTLVKSHYTLPGEKKSCHQKKGHTHIFRWTAFSFDYGTHALWQFLISFSNVTRFISVQWCIHFSPKSWIDDGRVGPLCKAFSSKSQRFSMGFRSGRCGGQSVCENDVSCSLNHSFTIWAWWILELSPWNMAVPSGIRKIHWWNNLVIQYIQVVSWPYSLGT